MRLHGHQNDFQGGGTWSLRMGIGVGKIGGTRYYLQRMEDPGLPSASTPLDCCTILNRFLLHSDDDYLM